MWSDVHMLWVAMDGRLVLVVFGVAVLLPYCTGRRTAGPVSLGWLWRHF